MSNQQYHVTFDSLKEIIYKLLDHWHLKAVFAYLALLISWTFNGQVEVIFVVTSLLLIDVITGTMVAFKTHTFSSRGFFRSPVKFLVYFLMLIVSRLADKSLPVQVLSPVMDSFIVVTEAISILENIYKLGFPVPHILVKRLKAYYEKNSSQSK